ncbi:hypothetical protein [Streptomyces sp. NPDC007088]|uniref:hypothetical protein n=1 Tax=Streptomyces sp. NPDC007088 TaxID=3364773 RepID=UPI003691711E
MRTRSRDDEDRFSWPFALLVLGVAIAVTVAVATRAPTGRHPGPPTDTYQDFPWLRLTGGLATATAVGALVAVATRWRTAQE